MNNNETILFSVAILFVPLLMFASNFNKPDYSNITDPVVACYAASSTYSDREQCKLLAEKLHVPLQNNH